MRIGAGRLGLGHEVEGGSMGLSSVRRPAAVVEMKASGTSSRVSVSGSAMKTLLGRTWGAGNRNCLWDHMAFGLRFSEYPPETRYSADSREAMWGVGGEASSEDRRRGSRLNLKMGIQRFLELRCGMPYWYRTFRLSGTEV